MRLSVLDYIILSHLPVAHQEPGFMKYVQKDRVLGYLSTLLQLHN
jgi:hypothetical protein